MVKFPIILPAALLALSSNSARAQDANANYCEFYVDGLAIKYSYNMGWSRTSLLAELVARDAGIERLGLWIRSIDTTTRAESVEEISQPLNTEGQREMLEFTLTEIQPPAYGGHPGTHRVRTAVEFAFFAIQSHSGVQRRLWLSNHGKNFRYEDAMRGPVYPVNLGRTTLTWSNQNSPLFDQKRVCL